MPDERSTAEEAIVPEVIGEDEPRPAQQPAVRGAHASPRGKVSIPRADWGVDYNRPSVKDAQRAARPLPAPDADAAPSPVARLRALFANAVVPAVAVFAASCLCAAVLAWGNPVLWMTSDQELASRYAEGTDANDYAFLDAAIGDSIDTEDVVVLGEYQAISQAGDAARASNLSLAAAAIDGLEIAPGATVSLNELIGDVAHDERYQDAPSFTGEVVQRARGGGVCQVATALYIAALKANLEIVERSPHAMVCDYAPIGLDATLVYGEKDLKVRNGSETPVYLRASAVGQTVDVRIYGKRHEGNVTFDATSRITDRFEDTVGNRISDPAAAGLDPEATLTFYSAEAYQSVYRDDAMIGNELVSADIYRVCTGRENEIIAGS